MKKVFIGLLIIAAGAGAYYFLQKKKTEAGNPFEKELLVGKWEMDSIHLTPKDSSNLVTALLLNDSTFRKYQYEFQKGGTFVKTLNDSVKTKADTSYYEWNKKNELLIKESAKDSIGEAYSVNKLNIDSLVLQSKDSAVLVLTKLK
ncbi:MAG TPA: hypothetical protein VI461_15805 [Chitinophagaceae bacterium]|nr:hypothetical protein [Chitinophagaceae bacterium]